jgi:hypothetical protein
MNVQTFWYQIRDINKQIEWLPGSVPVSTDEDQQLKQIIL